MAPERAELTVSRSDPKDLGTGDVILQLDKEPIGMLKLGQSITRDIAPGPHELRATNRGRSKTVRFNVLPNMHVKFVTKNYEGTLTTVGLMFGFGLINISLEKVTDWA